MAQIIFQLMTKRYRPQKTEALKMAWFRVSQVINQSGYCLFLF